MNIKKIILCLMVLTVIFAGVYTINEKATEENNYGDMSIDFKEKTIVGEKLVFYNKISDYDKYHVVKFFDNNYIVHCYYYFDNNEEYLNIRRDFSDRIVDYNYDKLMVRTVEDYGNMTYNEYLNKYNDFFNNGNYVLIY